MDPSLFITKKAMLLQNFGFLQHPPKLGYIQRLQHWAFYNTKKFKFTNYEGFILDRPRLHGEELELLAMSSLIRSPNYLPQILSVHIYMTTPLVYACPCRVGNRQGFGYNLNCKQWSCISLGVDYECYVSRMDRNQSRAQIFNASKKGRPTNGNWTLSP